jgi:hypothetical protein
MLMATSAPQLLLQQVSQFPPRASASGRPTLNAELNE